MGSDVRIATCNLCDAMCGLHVTVEDEHIVSVRPNPNDVFSRGHICPKGVSLKEIIEDPDRLRQPMRRTSTGWQPIGWDEALDEVATNIQAVQAKHGNDSIATYIGNPTAHGHRAALGSQVLELAIGSKIKFDSNSQDSNARIFACMQVFGDGLSMAIPDVDHTDLLIIFGGNPAATNGSHMSAGDMRVALKGIRERGGRIIVVDPRRTETAGWSDTHHFIRPGADAAVLLAMIHVLFRERLIDEIAVDKIANGLPELWAIAAKFPPARVSAASGMRVEVISDLARALAKTKRAVLYARVGLCQNEFSPVASWLVEIVNVLTGHFDTEGGAMFTNPAVNIGPLARLLIGNNYGRWKSRIRGLPEFLGALPSAVMSEEMETPGPGQIRGLLCSAGNPVLSTPNGERLGRALAKLDYMVSIDPYINETSRHAHIVLPPKLGLETGSYDLLLTPMAVRNFAKYSQPVVAGPPGMLDDWEIACELAIRMKAPKSEKIRGYIRRIAKTLPERVIDLLLRVGPYPLSMKTLRAAPNGIDLGPMRPGAFPVFTDDKKIRLVPEVFVGDLPRLHRWVDEQASRAAGLVLIGRRHLRSNNSWMHNTRTLVKGPDRSHLMMNPDDAARLSLKDGMKVQVKSRVGTVTATLSVTADIMPGVVSMPHGYGHAVAAETLHVAGPLPGQNVNALTDELLVEPIIGTSVLNGVPVTVEAAPAPPPAPAPAGD